MAKAALILSGPWPGMSTTVSRGIESLAEWPRPERMSMIVSERDGPPQPDDPQSGAFLERASDPSTRMVLAEVSGKPPPSSALSAEEETLLVWIWALTMNSTSDRPIQAAIATATHRTT